MVLVEVVLNNLLVFAIRNSYTVADLEKGSAKQNTILCNAIFKV